MQLEIELKVTEEEVWKAVEGYEKRYLVSNLGRIKRPTRIEVRNNRARRPQEYRIKEAFLKCPINKEGYRNLNLKNGVHVKSKLERVHRLVAKAFIPNPKNLPFVNHINGIKTDNRVENLEWCTPQYNAKHAGETGLVKRGEQHWCFKLTDAQAIEIREKYAKGDTTHRKLGKEFGVSSMVIFTIVNRVSRKNV